ncbi:hypothetical protein [Cellulomonas fimi]|uniref:PH domain-containing protein n=1 Tax=Cellulomonas fimi (strain ATCC 484 / DSM 20113 / JCM 1341 / CCUG 24087 / LMG 16345 / NBRC 15513 / NCIMB 8980 / NCTC 7547 / NRS-133) TaxID=590998 RepID=F4H062_CELFA|nr:hypothetical protein [Cellulomonas fimi]AEE46109.1 hypothetical protein Celf_1979 [Cellulomonas fimi ATCC 484]NNH08444.1 hypothetical protein [Cellulomonas fimi]VEH31667.1 Uncharacterised protein [Cellulomonas fimi]
MRPWVSVVVLVLVAVLALWGMRAGWLGRRRRTEGLVPQLPVAPDDLGPARFGPVEAVYVSTTRAGDWLDRVAAHDLGVRSPAQVSVHDAGVLVSRTGATDVFVPAPTLRGAGTAPGIAGKVVGKDGLVVLTWQPHPDDPRGLDTGLRTRHAADRPLLVAAAAALVDAPVDTTDHAPGATGPDVTPGTAGQEEKP